MGGAAATGCGSTGGASGPEPLGAAGPSTPPAPSTAAPTAAPTPPPPPDPVPSAAPDGERPVPADADRDLVDEVLDRYGRALTALAAEPAALDDPAHPGRTSWEAVVVPGSAVATEVTGRIRARAADGVVVVPPPSSDRSFVHRALTAVRATPTEVSFTWCGWSPGVGRAVAGGAVVDDTVAHSRGTGSIVDDGTGWRVATLDETELVVLAPGSADPCPGEAEAVTGAAP